MPVTGRGERKVLVVAEAPGEEEDKRNYQLIGPAGQTLRRHLKKIGVDLDRDCWKTNAVTCRSQGKPSRDQVLACRSNLLKTIRETNPSTIILMGGTAVDSLIGWLWKENPGPIGRWIGWKIPCQKLNAWVCPTFHPSYVMRTEKEPKFEGRVWIYLNVKGAAEEIGRMVDFGKPVAFDYECNMLKPDSDEAEIVTCAMSNGKQTIAFPMHGPAVQVFREFLRSPLPKIAQNMKFEDRWSRAVLKTEVKNWTWCTMNNAHVLDNRRKITGLKFQAFARLGQGSYDDSVEPFLKSPSSNEKNRIRQADLRDLLLYNGMDSLLTWLLAKKQRKEMKG
jgi:DNA polymerase